MTKSNQPIAVISGGAGDIGRAIARELAGRGADVALGDVAEADQRVATLQADVEKLDRRFRFDAVDVTDPSAVDEWLSNVEQELGTANWIIPNAAIAPRSDLDQVTPQQWKDCLDVNLNGAFYLASAAARRLKESQMPGRIVFVGSWAAHAPHDNVPAYCVSKAALRMLMQTMALHYASCGILINEVAPGYVDAGLSKVGFDEDPEARRRAHSQVPLGELITADEVAYHVAYLCDERNRSMTGATLLVDGGLSLNRKNAAPHNKVPISKD